MHAKEIRDLVISAIVLAFMFSFQGFARLDAILWIFPVGLLTISISFLAHEMAHRHYAKRYGCHAEYQIWWYGVIVALVFSLFSDGAVKFAALGAVMIYPMIDMWGNTKVLSRRQYGIISVAGPVINLILVGVFLLLGFFIYQPLYIGAIINVWLAIFNLLPIWILDGAKVFRWNKAIWIAVFALSVAIFIAMMYSGVTGF